MSFSFRLRLLWSRQIAPRLGMIGYINYLLVKDKPRETTDLLRIPIIRQPNVPDHVCNYPKDSCRDELDRRSRSTSNTSDYDKQTRSEGHKISDLGFHFFQTYWKSAAFSHNLALSCMFYTKVVPSKWRFRIAWHGAYMKSRDIIEKRLPWWGHRWTNGLGVHHLGTHLSEPQIALVTLMLGGSVLSSGSLPCLIYRDHGRGYGSPSFKDRCTDSLHQLSGPHDMPCRTTMHWKQLNL